MRPADLEAFVVRAKSATYVGNGLRAQPSRLGSQAENYYYGYINY